MSKKKKNLVVGKQIVADKVRVIDAEGTQLGIISLEEALAKADEAGLQLVEVCPTLVPTVCRIMDYEKFKYKQQKLARESKKKQLNVSVKEVRVRPHIKDHDLQVKIRNIQRFLNNSDRVKVSIVFRGRELGNKQLGVELLDRIIKELESVGAPDREPMMDGRFLITFLLPNKKGKKNA